MTPRWYYLDINPEPWAVGSVSVGKRNGHLTGSIGPDPNLQGFQNAVRESLVGVKPLPEGPYKLTFFFWREVIKYVDTSDHIRHRNQADATNMQKALEDALQGTLFSNDRDVADVHSIIMAQGEDVRGRIIISAEMAPQTDRYYAEFPKDILNKVLGEAEQVDEEPDKWAAEDDELF